MRRKEQAERRAAWKAWLLADIAEYGGTNSLDEEALHRFEACVLAPEDLLAVRQSRNFYLRSRMSPSMRDLLRATTVWTRRERIRLLGELVKEGHLEAGWAGTGERGMNDVGTNRARTYELKAGLLPLDTRDDPR